MADLPRYQRALIESPDVTATNISALVQAQARTTEAIMTGLDKLVSYSIDIGEKKEAEQKKADKLLALETGIEAQSVAKQEYLKISNNIASLEEYDFAMLEAELAHASFIFKPLEKLDREVYLEFVNKFNDDAFKLREKLNNKIIEDKEVKDLKTVNTNLTTSISILEDSFSNLTIASNGENLLNLIAKEKVEFVEGLEVLMPENKEAQKLKYDTEVALLINNKIVDSIIDEIKDNTGYLKTYNAEEMFESNKFNSTVQPLWNSLSQEDKQKVKKMFDDEVAREITIQDQEEQNQIKQAKDVYKEIYTTSDQAEKEQLWKDNKDLLKTLQLQDFKNLKDSIFVQKEIDTGSIPYIKNKMNYIALASTGNISSDQFLDMYADLNRNGFYFEQTDLNKITGLIANKKPIINDEAKKLDSIAFKNEDGVVVNPYLDATIKDQLSAAHDTVKLEFLDYATTLKEDGTLPTVLEIKEFAQQSRNKINDLMIPTYTQSLDIEREGIRVYDESYNQLVNPQTNKVYSISDLTSEFIVNNEQMLIDELRRRKKEQQIKPNEVIDKVKNFKDWLQRHKRLYELTQRK